MSAATETASSRIRIPGAAAASAHAFSGGRYLHNAFSIGGVISLSLTFFHPVMWLAVGFCAGSAALLILASFLWGRRSEPPMTLCVALWIGATLLVAVCYGMTQELFNVRQIAVVTLGAVLGYFISLDRAPRTAAWLPFCAFALYFGGLLVLGRDPGAAFSRNSQNYVSVVMLALYASANLLTRPRRAEPWHLLTALVVLGLSIWGSGRGGILASLVLCAGLFLHVLLRGRLGVIRSTLAAGAVLTIAVAALIGAEYLRSSGFVGKFASRGLHDPSRISIVISYFRDIEPSELLLGKNYYHDAFMEQWGYNLHNSYLSAWAHLGLPYLLFLLGVLALLASNVRRDPVTSIAALAFALRALTDTQLLCGQYDYIVFAAIFLLLRERSRSGLSLQRVS
jgi:hypothetical protein